MKTPVLLTFAAALMLFTSAAATARDGLSIAHTEALRHLEIRNSGPLQRGDVRLLEPVSMQFEAFGRRFDLALEPNTGLLSPAAKALVDERIDVLRGRVEGSPGSWARIVLTDGTPSGLIYDGTELLAIEPPGDSAVDNAEPVVFRLADMVIEPGTLSCGAGSSPANGQVMYQDMVGELRTALQTGPGLPQWQYQPYYSRLCRSDSTSPTIPNTINTRLPMAPGGVDTVPSGLARAMAIRPPYSSRISTYSSGIMLR